MAQHWYKKRVPGYDGVDKESIMSPRGLGWVALVVLATILGLGLVAWAADPAPAAEAVADPPTPLAKAAAVAIANQRTALDRLEQARQALLVIVNEDLKLKVEDLFREAMEQVQSFQVDELRG